MRARSPIPEIFFSPGSPAKTNSLSSATVSSAFAAVQPSRVATRFGPAIDVRNRGVFKVLTNTLHATANQHLAVVRIWSGDSCREMSSDDARIFASQLIAAAAYAESQNSERGQEALIDSGG